jgi:FLVCR family MFS transporter 7
MTSQSAAEEVRHERPKNQNNDATAPATPVKRSGFTAKAKETPFGEILPGWTIMRPLRGSTKASAATTTALDGVGVGVDGKGTSDLKVTETNGAGDAYDDVGEVEALQQIRSHDEFLGPDDREGPCGAARENGDPTEHPLQGNGAASVERTATGAGEYKVYKRRWFGLVQLVLLNIIVSWDVGSVQLGLCKPEMLRSCVNAAS